MNRSTKLAILSSMDDKVLSQACQAVGINCEGEEYGGGDDRPDMDEQLESWNTMRVPFGQAHHKEPLWLPSQVLRAPKEAPSTPTHLGYASDVQPESGAGDYSMYEGGEL